MGAVEGNASRALVNDFGADGGRTPNQLNACPAGSHAANVGSVHGDNVLSGGLGAAGPGCTAGKAVAGAIKSGAAIGKIIAGGNRKGLGE